MELKFKAVRHKSMNPYLSKMVAGVFVLGILALANWVDDYLLLINYCIYALVAVLIFVGIYFIYFKLVGSEQQNLSFVSIEDEYFVFNKNKYHWNDMQFIQVRYRSHYVLSDQVFNEINEFQFDHLGEHYMFHFTLENEEDLQRYLQMLQKMYDKNLEFTEEVSTIGYTKMMQPIQNL